MQLLHPEFLYFLFLLIIPIIVHLFQLRKFKKTPFTNVAFLKKVTLQTRKSSQLKKWLILLARLLALACIILAFAQPFLPKSETATKPKETLIYLDNSFSMQLEGKRGELLKRAVQELLESLPPEKTFTLVTNEKEFVNTTIGELKKELLQLGYSSVSPSLNTILLRAGNRFSVNSATLKQVIAISDFQTNAIDLEAISPEKKQLSLIQLKPVNTNNSSIDSLRVSESGIDKFNIEVWLSHSGEQQKTVPVSLFVGNKLIAKSSADFDDTRQANLQFTLNKTDGPIEGKVSLADNGLQYDNRFYFAINPPEKINVVVLSNAETAFLQKIYQKKDFNYSEFETGEFDYNQIATANTVILNGLEKIPSSLIPILSQLIEKDGNLVVIPSEKIDFKSYQNLLVNLEAPIFSSLTEEEKTITNIVFSHPLYQNVFEDHVENFQYPTTETSYELRGNSQAILTYANGEAFLAQSGQVYIFTASLAGENSNFKNSPLVVPTFYNIAKQSLRSPKAFYTIGKKSSYDVKADLQKDEIVSIANSETSFIPQQQSEEDKVKITTSTLPKEAGIYQITKNGKRLQAVAYNYNRKESELSYANLEQLDSINLANQVETFFEQQAEQNEIAELWKWFVIFAVFFLLIELFLLRYIK